MKIYLLLILLFMSTSYAEEHFSLEVETKGLEVTNIKGCGTSKGCFFTSKLYKSAFDVKLIEILGQEKVGFIRRNAFHEITELNNKSVYAFTFFLMENNSTVALNFGDNPELRNTKIVRAYIGKISDRNIVREMIIAFIDELSNSIEDQNQEK